MKESPKINGRWLSRMDGKTKEWAKMNTVSDLKSIAYEIESLGEDVTYLKKLVQDLDEMAYAITLTEDAVESEYLGIERDIHEEVETEA